MDCAVWRHIYISPSLILFRIRQLGAPITPHFDQKRQGINPVGRDTAAGTFTQKRLHIILNGVSNPDK